MTEARWESVSSKLSGEHVGNEVTLIAARNDWPVRSLVTPGGGEGGDSNRGDTRHALTPSMGIIATQTCTDNVTYWFSITLGSYIGSSLHINFSSRFYGNCSEQFEIKLDKNYNNANGIG